MENESILEGSAVSVKPQHEENGKSGKNGVGSAHVAKDAAKSAASKPKRKGRGWLVVLGLFLGLVLCLGAFVGLAFGAGLLLSPNSPIARQIAEIPVLDRMLPAKTRAEIAFNNYEATLQDADSLAEYKSMPREFEVTMSESADQLIGIGSFDASTTLSGRSNETASAATVVLDMDVGGFKTSAEGELVTVTEDQQMFFKAVNVPEIVFRLLAESNADEDATNAEISASAEGYRGEMIGQWYEYMPENSTVGQSQIEVIQGIIEDAEYEYVSVETIRDQESYKFEVNVDERDLENELKELVDAVASAADSSSDMSVQYENLQLYIWLNNKGYITRMEFSVDMTSSIDAGYSSEYEATIEIYAVIESWDFDQAQTITLPEETKPVEDVVELFASDVLGVSDTRLPNGPAD